MLTQPIYTRDNQYDQHNTTLNLTSSACCLFRRKSWSSLENVILLSKPDVPFIWDCNSKQKQQHLVTYWYITVNYNNNNNNTLLSMFTCVHTLAIKGTHTYGFLRQGRHHHVRIHSTQEVLQSFKLTVSPPHLVTVPSFGLWVHILQRTRLFTDQSA